MSDRLTTPQIIDALNAARAELSAKDKEIERLKAELGAAEGLIATLTEQQAQVRESTLSAFSDRDAEAERLKADNAALTAYLVDAADGQESPFRGCLECGWLGHHGDGCRLGSIRIDPRPGTAILEELTRLRSILRDIGERLVAAGGTRDGTILEQLNAVLQRAVTTSP